MKEMLPLEAKNYFLKRLALTNWLAVNYFLTGKSAELDNFLQFRAKLLTILDAPQTRERFEKCSDLLSLYYSVFAGKLQSGEYCVINPSNYKVDKEIFFNDKTYHVEVNPRSKAEMKEIEESVGDLEAAPDCISNSRLQLCFGKNGELLSIFDKKTNLTFKTPTRLAVCKTQKDDRYCKENEVEFNYEHGNAFVGKNRARFASCYFCGKKQLSEMWILEHNSSKIYYSCHFDTPNAKKLTPYLLFSCKNEKAIVSQNNLDVYGATKATSATKATNATTAMNATNATNATETRALFQSQILNMPDILDVSTQEGGIAMFSASKCAFCDNIASVAGVETGDSNAKDVTAQFYVHEGSAKDSDMLFEAGKAYSACKYAKFDAKIDNFVEVDNDGIFVDEIKLSDDKKEIKITFKELFGEQTKANIKVAFRSLGAFVQDEKGERRKIDAMPIAFAPYECVEINFVV